MSLEEDKYHLTKQVPQINSLQDLQASEGCSPSAKWRRGDHFCGSENQGDMRVQDSEAHQHKCSHSMIQHYNLFLSAC